MKYALLKANFIYGADVLTLNISQWRFYCNN